MLQPRAENYHLDAFNVNGLCGWKDGRELFHVLSNGGIDHNKSRRAYENFKNQRQNRSHMMNRGAGDMNTLIVALGIKIDELRHCL
jgi:hypothetical protein